VNDTVKVLLIALASAGGVAVVGSVLLYRLRMRSLQASLLAIPVTAVLAVVVAVLANAQAMFLSAHDARVVLIVCVVAGLVATVVTVMLGRHLIASSERIQEALRTLGDGTEIRNLDEDISNNAPAELAALAQQLAVTTERLAQSRERDRSQEAARRELVAWISHDLRTPLASLRAVSEALEDGLAEDPSAFLKHVRNSVGRLEVMVGDLFELSRLNAGVGSDSRDHVFMQEVIDQAIAAVHGLSVAHQVEVVARGADDSALHGNQSELVRLLTNLVANGIRHSPPGTSVNITASEQDQHLMVEVIDACGEIPTEHLDHVFETGWRGSEARTPADGAGLGLAIAEAIARSHDGSLDVRNVKGGCAFRLTLPLGDRGEEGRSASGPAT